MLISKSKINKHTAFSTYINISNHNVIPVHEDMDYGSEYGAMASIQRMIPFRTNQPGYS